MSRRDNYEPYVPLDTRGAGLIGIMTCKRCGAVVMLDKRETPELHDKWHERLADTSDATADD